MTSTIDINGLGASFSATGEGADVVLMHGWGCDHTIWQSLARHLEGRFRVTALDFPGFGASAEPPTAWGIEDYARWFEAFVEARGITNPVLVGHSFGGRVAILHASRHRVGKVVLVDSAGVKPRRTLRYWAKVWSYKVLKQLAPLVVGATKAAEIIERRRAKSSSADYLAASPVMRGILSRVVNEDLRHAMPHITAPTLLVWGERDTATPLADAKKMERLIPDAGLVVFAGAGHYSFLDEPKRFAAVLDSFLNS